MAHRPSIIERAYELAKSSTVENVDQLVGLLKREGYEAVEAHVGGGTSLRRELNGLCRAAWAEAGNAPSLPRRRG
jgi:hypothetical protein